ncbi:hypothetical protein Tco_0766748 [Tanacetum coccineum]
MPSWTSSESRVISDDDLPSEYYKELLYGMFQKQKRLKKYVNYEKLIGVLAMDKSMLEEELRATKSKLKLYDRMVCNCSWLSLECKWKLQMQMQAANANPSCKWKLQMEAANGSCKCKCKCVLQIQMQNGMKMQAANAFCKCKCKLQMKMQAANASCKCILIASQVLAFASPSAQFVIGTWLLTMSVFGDALAFEEDDPDALVKRPFSDS